MQGFHKNAKLKEYIDRFDNKQRKGFDVILTLVKHYFPDIDCWTRNEYAAKNILICFGVRVLGSKKGLPVFGLTNGSDNSPVVFRMTCSSDKIYEGIESIHGARWNREELQSSHYYFTLKGVANEPSSLKAFLAKMSIVASVTKRTEGGKRVPDNYYNEKTVVLKNGSTHPDKVVMKAIIERRGQPKFRGDLLEYYNETCVVSGCRDVEALEAAHIIPHSEGGDYSRENGLLLRADIHTLYDLGFISIDHMGIVHVSPKLKDITYRKLDKKKVKGIDCSKLRANLRVKFAKYKEK